MKQNNIQKNLIGKRSALFRKLLKLRNILPGSYSVRKIPCGKTNCVCKREGKAHTGYQHSYKLGPQEKAKTKMIPKDFAKQVEKQVSDNKEFKKIMKQIHKINLEILANQLQKRKK
jgi:hypothetical protein